MECSNWNPQKMIGWKQYLGGDLWLQLGSLGRAGICLFSVLLTGRSSLDLNFCFSCQVSLWGKWALRFHASKLRNCLGPKITGASVWPGVQQALRRVGRHMCALPVSFACGHAWVQNNGNGLKLRQWLIWHQRTVVSIPIPNSPLSSAFETQFLWNHLNFFSFKLLRNSLDFHLFLDLVAVRLWENQVLYFVCLFNCWTVFLWKLEVSRPGFHIYAEAVLVHWNTLPKRSFLKCCSSERG